jgi:CheY-like chemotaxis protein
MLCDDLIFFSRVAGAARAGGFTVRMVKLADELLAQAKQHLPAAIILDLNLPELDLTDMLEKLRAACTAMPCLVAYGSHVEAEVLRSARKAGCDLVMPRSQFVANLETDLPVWFDTWHKSKQNDSNQ